MTNFALLQTNIAFCDPEANFKAGPGAVCPGYGQRTPVPTWSSCLRTGPPVSLMRCSTTWRTSWSRKNGPSVTVLRELARQYQVWVVGGSIATLHADGKMRNTTFLIDRRGEIVGDYSKMHLYSDMDEHVPFANGDKTEVYDTELGRLGMMICYDIRFCELARTYALKKADVLVVTSDFPNPRVNHWRTLLTARAIENQMFVVACNRVGPSPMGTYCGHSIIIDPWGDIIAEGGGEEEIITGSIDYTKTREVRDLIHMFRDRQPTLYGDTLLRPVD